MPKLQTYKQFKQKHGTKGGPPAPAEGEPAAERAEKSNGQGTLGGHFGGGASARPDESATNGGAQGGEAMEIDDAGEGSSRQRSAEVVVGVTRKVEAMEVADAER